MESFVYFKFYKKWSSKNWNSIELKLKLAVPPISANSLALGWPSEPAHQKETELMEGGEEGRRKKAVDPEELPRGGSITRLLCLREWRRTVVTMIRASTSNNENNKENGASAQNRTKETLPVQVATVHVIPLSSSPASVSFFAHFRWILQLSLDGSRNQEFQIFH